MLKFARVCVFFFSHLHHWIPIVTRVDRSLPVTSRKCASVRSAVSAVSAHANHAFLHAMREVPPTPLFCKSTLHSTQRVRVASRSQHLTSRSTSVPDLSVSLRRRSRTAQMVPQKRYAKAMPRTETVGAVENAKGG